MVRLDHPTVKDVHEDVPAKDVKRWERSGWVKPATSTEKPSPSSSGASTSTNPAPPETAANEKE